MIGITLTAEQVKTAPPEVRRWIEGVLRKELSLEEHHPLQREGFRYAEGDLAICGLPEVSQIFTLLRREPDACRLFLALGCDNYDRTRGIHVPRPINIAELTARFGVGDFAALLPGFEVINNALRQIRRDASATLFLVDGEERLLVHQETQWHIHQLLQLLTGTEARQATVPPGRSAVVSVAPPYQADKPIVAAPAPELETLPL